MTAPTQIYLNNQTIHRLFEEQVEKTPDHIAVIGMENEALCMASLTYRELNRKANQLAHQLIERGVKPNCIVAIMVERCIEMVIGLLGILKAGGAYLPIDPDYPDERIRYILADTGAKILLSTRSLKEKITIKKEMIYLEDYKRPAMIPEKNPATTSLNLAYIIYTSGSTGEPKGVMVEHHSAVNVLLWFGRQYQLGENTRVLQFSSYTFDPSVEQIFGTLLFGAELYLADNQWLANISQLRHYIIKNKINIVNFVPFVLDDLLGYEEKIESIDVVITGAEPLTDSIKNRIIERGYNLYNHYGPTETTIEVLTGKMSEQGVNLGKPIANTHCFIVDQSGNIMEDGESGELWIAGAGVARGYLNNPGLTADQFDRDFQDLHDYQEKKGSAARKPSRTKKKKEKGSDRLRLIKDRNMSYMSYTSYLPYLKRYRTGDLCRQLPNGNIEFLGRIDHQVKIRGFRIEPGEIETRLLMHEGIKEAVVTARENQWGEKYLCAYVVPHSSPIGSRLKTPELRHYLSGLLPGYMIPSYFIKLDKLPLTPHGKADLQALLEMETDEGTREYVPPRNKTEEKIVEIWSEILGIEKGKIGIEDDFYELGGHSLKANMVIMNIHKQLNRKINLSDIFSIPTIKEMARYIKETATENKYEPIETGEKREFYPLSSAQKRLYILQQVEITSTGYNMPMVYMVEGKPGLQRLKETVQTLIRRHESFRTSFHIVDGNPLQKIHEAVTFELEFFDLSKNQDSHDSPLHFINRFVRAFDLSHPPLLRVGVIKIEEEKYILMLDMHHIISDGVSFGIFVKDFCTLFRDETLPPLPVQYKDYSIWQKERAGSEMLKEQEAYWLKEFQGEVPLAHLPLDYPRPQVQSFEGESLIFEVDRELINRLKKQADETGTTLFMVLTAAYNVLLSRYTGQEDIVVGIPTAGRLHPDLQPIIGMFANTIALRNTPHPHQSFTGFLEKVKEKLLNAFKNQDYPFDRLIDRLHYQREPGRNPLFDTMFVLQNMDIEAWEIEDLKITPYEYERQRSTFDISIEGYEKEDGVVFYLEYCTRLFKRETIKKMTVHFRNILKVVAENPSTRLSEIEMATEKEKEQVLVQFSTVTDGGQYDFD